MESHEGVLEGVGPSRVGIARSWMEWARGPVAALGLLVLVAVTVRVALAAAAAPSFLVPASRGGFPGWLAGPLPGGPDLTPTGFGIGLALQFGGYLAVLWGWRAISPRVLLGAVVLLHLIVLLAPPLLSADVFGYLDYAHLGTTGIDPYVHGAAADPTGVLRPFVRWHDIPSPYGPLFTLASYGLAPLGPGGGLWTLKVLTALCSLGCVALTWSIAKGLGRPAVAAAAFVGLNPFLLLFAVGGAHNDLLVVLLTLAGVACVVSTKERGAAASIVAAAGMKASAGLVAPFMLVAARPAARRRMIATGLVAVAVLGAIAVAGFGTHAFDFLNQISSQQRLVATRSVPNRLALLIGFSGEDAGVRLTAHALLAIGLGVAFVRALRGADWISCAGWATLTVLVTTTWLLPWYVVWLTPLAALGSDRRLRVATLCLCAYLVWMFQPAALVLGT